MKKKIVALCLCVALAVGAIGGATLAYFTDKTCEGMDYTRWNCKTVQFHPEASGGPKDCEFLFDEFISRIAAAKGVTPDA